MRRHRHSPDGRDGTPAVVDARRIVTLLREDDLDGAIDEGLMACTDDALCGLEDATRELLVQTQQRLQAAWDARVRYRVREARLARRKAERDARRVAASSATATEADRGSPPASPAAAPVLPAAAAAALARAKARAGSS